MGPDSAPADANKVCEDMELSMKPRKGTGRRESQGSYSEGTGSTTLG